MYQTQAHESFFRLLRQISGEYRALMVDQDISGPQLVLLELLRSRGPQKISVLAEHMYVTVGNVTLLADRLHKAHLIERERSETDRRVVLLSLTAEGDALVERTRAIRNRVFSRYFGALNPEELEHFGRLIEKMLAASEKSTQE